VNLNVNDRFIGLLENSACLTARQIQDLQSIDSDKSGPRCHKLLEIMLRRSVKDFKAFLECLETNKKEPDAGEFFVVY